MHQKYAFREVFSTGTTFPGKRPIRIRPDNRIATIEEDAEQKTVCAGNEDLVLKVIYSRSEVEDDCLAYCSIAY